MNNWEATAKPYFGYGTLLGASHMQSRYPSAKVIGLGVYSDHELGFWRYSDGVEGGGCTIVESPGNHLLGVLYRLDPADEAKLLAVDGLRDQYETRNVEVTDQDGNPVQAYTLRVHPYHGGWPPPPDYAELVTNGAEEAKLPAPYRARINEIIAEAQRGM